jgi:hypothetical protein
LQITIGVCDMTHPKPDIICIKSRRLNKRIDYQYTDNQCV